MSTEQPVNPEIPENKSKNDERTWGMACHLSSFAGLVIPYFGNVIGPLVVWLIKKDEFPFVNDQGKESLNFQISITIYLAIATVLTFILIGIPLLIAIAIFDIVEVILASVKASDGIPYRYPMTIRFIK
ncbi:MAG: DUF4870 domain-containing protein [Armatimonadota bacterium]